jgi:hypothetical protein
MITLIEYISESLLCEAVKIDSEGSQDFEAFMEYVKKYSKSLKIQSAEKQRYEAKGTPITQDIAQSLLSRRLHANVSLRYTTDPEFFVEICKKYGITVNMSNLGFGKGEVISWEIPEKKINPKHIYFDDDELVWYDKTIGYLLDDGGIELLDMYKCRADEILTILKKKYKGADFYIVEDEPR